VRQSAVQSNFDKRDSLDNGGKPMSGRHSVRSESFHRQNVQLLAGLFCKREHNACFFLPLIEVPTILFGPNMKKRIASTRLLTHRSSFQQTTQI
jgi:hypothetical protein